VVSGAQELSITGSLLLKITNTKILLTLMVWINKFLLMMLEHGKETLMEVLAVTLLKHLSNNLVILVHKLYSLLMLKELLLLKIPFNLVNLMVYLMLLKHA